MARKLSHRHHQAAQQRPAALGKRLEAHRRKDIADYEDCECGFKSDNAPEKTRQSLIAAKDAENISITGFGEIHGEGLSFFDTSQSGSFFKKPSIPRPRLLTPYKCSNVRLKSISFHNSPCWTIWLLEMRGIHISGIRVYGDPRMINNDGIDLDCCRNGGAQLYFSNG